MAPVDKDAERDERIIMEIVVDANGEEERVMGWYYYLDDTLHVPFQARCIAKQARSPLRPGETVEVTGMAPEDDCTNGMFVAIRWQDRDMAVPLAQLEGIDVDEQTAQAIADWHYWVERGYEF